MSLQGSLSRARYDDAEAASIIAANQHLDGAMLPILHALQEALGYVDPLCVPQIARALNVSKAEVHGVISFYHDFRAEPAGRRVLKICRAEACQAVGCETLVDHLARAHHLAPGDTAKDGSITIETVYCLGNCALGPAALLDGELIGRLDVERLDEIVLAAAGAHP